MKRTLLLLLIGLTCALATYAQKARTHQAASPSAPVTKEKAPKAQAIESIAANLHDTVWYAEQAQLWREAVNRNPQDQWAWRNLFRATYYQDMLNNNFGEGQDETATAHLLLEMEDRLPDSYVLNLCKGRFCLTTDTDAKEGKTLYRAYELLPDDAYPEDMYNLACHLWSIDPKHKAVNDLFRRTFEAHHIPEQIVRYNWNMLQSMQPNALYFGNGDNVVAPMKMLQAALGERTDVTIVPISFLYSPTFWQQLCEKLGIKPYQVDIQDYAQYGEKWQEHYEADFISYLIEQTRRPAYFFPDAMQMTVLNKDSLYNEGLLLKWSDRPYDNFGVAMHNVKEVYHLEYLADSFLSYSDWESSERLNLNNITLLSHLVNKLQQQGEKQAAQRLYDTLDTFLRRSRIDPEMKQKYEATLKGENETMREEQQDAQRKGQGAQCEGEGESKRKEGAR